MACGVASAQLASTATYPLAMVQRRIQHRLCAGGGVLVGIRTIPAMGGQGALQSARTGVRGRSPVVGAEGEGIRRWLVREGRRGFRWWLPSWDGRGC